MVDDISLRGLLVCKLTSHDYIPVPHLSRAIDGVTVVRCKRCHALGTMYEDCECRDCRD